VYVCVFQLTAGLYRRVLVILPDKVMPQMTSPIALCDFLTQAFNVGTKLKGATLHHVSVDSVQSFFSLIVLCLSE